MYNDNAGMYVVLIVVAIIIGVALWWNFYGVIWYNNYLLSQGVNATVVV